MDPGLRTFVTRQPRGGRAGRQEHLLPFAIGTFSGVPQRFLSSLLFEYDDVLITTSQRKLGEISLEKLSTLSLAVVSLGGAQEGAIDGFISERGLARRSEMYDRAAFERALSNSKRIPRIVVSIPHFLALPTILKDTDLAAIVPRPLAEGFVRTHPIAIHELPYPTLRLEVRQLWHERLEGDASQSWLREAVRHATNRLRAVFVK